MKIYIIKKFETITHGTYSYDPWKIVNDYDLILREIKNDLICHNEKLKIKYSTDPKNILIVEKIMSCTFVTLSREMNIDNFNIVLAQKIEPEEWPLSTYVVSEMEVITE